MSEFGTYLSILLAITCWSVALVTDRRIARIAWTSGLICYLVHVLFAFDAFYDWNHRIAMDITAQETAAVTGFSTGIGLWVNYGFGLILALDTWQQWRNDVRRFAFAIDGLVLFMILNGAVIFADGITRLYGIILFLAVILLRCRKTRLTTPENS